MVFILLNIAISIIFLAFTFYFDKKLQRESSDCSNFLTSLLIITIESILLTLVMILHTKWIDGIINYMIRGVILLDGFFWISFSFALLAVALKKNYFFINILKFALMIVAIAMVWSFDYVEVTKTLLFNVES